jgi:hypothetical protein
MRNGPQVGDDTSNARILAYTTGLVLDASGPPIT